MIIARELVDELKKIKDFDITYKSGDYIYEYNK